MKKMKKKMFRLIISCFMITNLIFITACAAEYILNASLTPIDGGTITPTNVSYKGADVAIPVEPNSGTYKDGTEVTLAAEPASGYRFDHWSGDITSNSGTTTIAMDTEKSVTAHFVAQYTLNTSISPSGGGTLTPTGNIHDKGTRVTLTATPASGYRFDYWSGDAEDTSPLITLNMDNNKSVTAHFTPKYTLSTSVNHNGGGTVTPSSGTYDKGTRVTLTATPASGYRFDHWSGDITGNSGATIIVMDSDMSVTAHFMGTGPAKVVGSIVPRSIAPTAWGENGCRWDYTVTFTETNGVEATIERLGRIYLDIQGVQWTVGAAEWFDKIIIIPPGGSSKYSSWVRTTNDSTPDLRSATVTVSFTGHDANGNAFSGRVQARLAPE